MSIAYIALGSNLGDCRERLNEALREMEAAGLSVRQVSTFIETEPYGVTDQPAFLNGVCEVETTMLPWDLLRLLLDIETRMGRIRTRHWGPRVIDLDLLLYDRLIIAEPPHLLLPHPDMQNRRFVLAPLAEIAPSLLHPQLKQTVEEMLDNLSKITVKEKKAPC